jgi:hypothetical protein
MNWSAEATLALLAQRLDGYRWAATSRCPHREAQVSQRNHEIQVSRRKGGEYHKRDHCRRLGLGER